MVGIAVAAVALVSVAIAGPDEPPVPVAGVERPLAPTSNPTTEAKVALGRALFSDRRISVDGSLSCASCHIASRAFTDGRPVPIGIGGKALGRNAPTLVNVGLVQQFFHDGRAPSLEEQARQVFLNPDELGWPDAEEPAAQIAAIAEYPPLFEAAFGTPDVSLQRMLRALAAFERTLVAGDAPFDRWWRGDADAMTEEQQRGYRLFIGDGGCVQCHSIRQSYATFADGRFHNTGAGADVRAGQPLTTEKAPATGKADPGRVVVSGRLEDTGAFRTPTLRNVELSGPYMHDGSLATLEAVVDFYVDGGGENPHLSPLMRPLELDEIERADLVAFLHALTSPEMPRLEECDRLLAEGRPAEALALFRAEIARDADNAAAVRGLARAALALDDRPPLLEAETRLRALIHSLSPDGEMDAAAAEELHLQGRVSAALSASEDAMGLARAEDAVIAWERVLACAAPTPLGADTAARLARWLEFMGRRDRAVEVAEQLATEFAEARELAAAVRYRRAWSSLSGDLSESERADLLRTTELLDALVAEGRALDSESVLFRPYAHHYLGNAAEARAAYLDAARSDETVAERALTGLRNLLVGSLDDYRSDLDALLAASPESPTALLFAGWERLQEGRLDEAAALLRRRIDAEPTPTPGPRVYLARVQRQCDERDAATTLYAEALAMDATFPGLVEELEAHVRSRPIDGFPAVAALVADYRDALLPARSDDARFQCLARNNVALILREVAASYTSRGAARHHSFAEGAPPEAREVLGQCVALYEEAVARVPTNAWELPFEDRWVYAGVLNDLGLMLHYFDDVRDVERAESLYLRAFDLTDGAYQDAYFYNLQFLYAFELDGRSERWFELAEVAKDAILREDPDDASGFSADPAKRRAAQRDWERLGAALGR